MRFHTLRMTWHFWWKNHAFLKFTFIFNVLGSDGSKPQKGRWNRNRWA